MGINRSKPPRLDFVSLLAEALPAKAAEVYGAILLLRSQGGFSWSDRLRVHPLARFEMSQSGKITLIGTLEVGALGAVPGVRQPGSLRAGVVIMSEAELEIGDGEVKLLRGAHIHLKK